ncbi:GNAT family N-acetyltransferase [Chromobacterium phragmitis]|uniref:GNAT family N-acetyltransferase n=1 Tax=Chromobacterium phragmitis TaxID=2202141 RepID=A0A344UMY8_9NEIS|nr:GNAT family protein [Chromobacterium phragmitis]AXE36636.1 GNAT family N-acetyltransferase [Chromobacterium phragmitis]
MNSPQVSAHSLSPVLPLPDWRSAGKPPVAAIQGEVATLLPLDAPRHGAALFRLFAGDDAHWEHLPYGPFSDEDAFMTWLALTVAPADVSLYVVFAKGQDQPLGFLGFRQTVQAHGAVEIGHVNFSAGLRRTRLATEAVYLLLRTAFQLGYRRCEWRCDSRNAASESAARRLGFRFEGTLRQAMVVKRRNRDTHVFSMLDSEWHVLRSAYEAYLADGNFSADGRQLRPLSDFLSAASEIA